MAPMVPVSSNYGCPEASTRDPEDDAQEGGHYQAHQDALRERNPEPIAAAVEDERRHDAVEELQREVQHGHTGSRV